ncbi:uncharacterized protein AMSG_02439 [Thecamonas trahens ATCC 50062]|uniref:CN hydrolase domain-containing protein n=1 Tax=Thecamonas trahens ATCC 50062 TaxID=461836 RepID=A0A0L0DWK4_THETB|nr:hypothetical protein AMSG_02439 [Thecamonas trahens ATCC 50062]KNC56471.1 hypothetical protein AMSG_02439 [Thecamonas trahens ATCC 50062]|eukprot:XP_013760980.1 hypothetical protein AMSG_02439 [Thecamonas trahens ATCC 50062]
MPTTHSLILALCLLSAAWLVSATPTWRGGVVAFTPTPYTATANATQVAASNLAAYADAAAAAAAADVELLVYPEFGVSSGEVFSGSAADQRAALTAFAQPLPSQAAIAAAAAGGQPMMPCGDARFDSAWQTQQLACIAARTRLWLVANLVEADGDKLYNADVVLDATGALVAKYRKSHVWFRKAYDEPVVPDLVSFNATWGGAPRAVGMMICFDIAFHSPGTVLVDQGIRIFPYAVAQGLVGPAIVKTWSALHGTTVLAANEGGHVSIYVAGVAAATTAAPAGRATVVYADLDTV